MANEGNASGGLGPTPPEQGSRGTSQRRTPPEQTLHQPSESSDTSPSSRHTARTVASTEPNPYGPEVRSDRLAVRSRSVRSLQEHFEGVDRAAGTISAVDSTQVPLPDIHSLTGSARLQTADSLNALEPSSPRRDPQNRAADPGRHRRQLFNSPGRGPVERAAQTLAVPSGAGTSDLVSTGESPFRTTISAGGSSSRPSPRRPASQTSPSRATASPSRGLPITPGRHPIGQPGSASRRIQLLIETELMISARDEQQHRGRDQSDFMRILMENHNRQPVRHEPHLRSPMRIFSYTDPPDIDDEKWDITQSAARYNGEYPYPLRLQSPAFSVGPISRWRAQVIATWEYLLQHYHVAPNPVIGSQIDIMLAPSYTLSDLRQIASSAIYFEPAIEALLPGHGHRHPDTQGPRIPHARSNWLDSPFLARRGKSRAQSIAAIEIAPDKEAVIRLMTGPRSEANPWLNRSYAWIFSDLFNNNMIGFRKPPTSSSANDVLNWAEFLITFVQAAVEFGSGASLRAFPSDLRGLRSFLAAVPSVAAVNEPSRWQNLWAGKQANAAVEPVPFWGTPEEEVVVDSAERNSVWIALRSDVARIRKDGGDVLK